MCILRKVTYTARCRSNSKDHNILLLLQSIQLDQIGPGSLLNLPCYLLTQQYPTRLKNFVNL